MARVDLGFSAVLVNILLDAQLPFATHGLASEGPLLLGALLPLVLLSLPHLDFGFGRVLAFASQLLIL